MIVSKEKHDMLVQFVQERYATIHGLEAMMLGDVAELIEKMTGRHVDWKSLAKYRKEKEEK